MFTINYKFRIRIKPRRRLKKSKEVANTIIQQVKKYENNK